MQNKAMRALTSVLAALALVLACFTAVGCGTQDSSSQIAATVLGQDIMESDVTEYIQKFRSGIQCDDDDAWKTYLEKRQMTPEDFRTMTIQELASPVIVQNKADELGITVDDSEVQEKVDDVRSALLSDDDDETWNSTLEHYGTTQEDMEDTYRKALLRSKVLEEVVGDVTPTQNDIKNYIEDKLLGQTTKKIAVIYSSSYSTLQAGLSKIQNVGNKSAMMKTAMKQADGKTVVGKVLGWDLDVELTDGMKEAIADLSKGDVVDELYSDGSFYYLFFIQDEYKFPKKISKLGKLNKSLKKAVSSLTAEELETSAGNLWLKQQIAQNTQVNDMPSGLSYDVEVDLSSVDSSSEDGGADDQTQDDSSSNNG